MFLTPQLQEPLDPRLMLRFLKVDKVCMMSMAVWYNRG